MFDQKFNFWQKWLTYANGLTILVGLLLAFVGNSFVFEIHNQYTRDIYFNGNAIPSDILRFKNLMFGIIGGTIVGFHVLMIMISENAFKNKETWAHRAMCYGILSWFIIDSSISIYCGALYNVILINVVALILIGVPLWMTRKEFK